MTQLHAISHRRPDLTALLRKQQDEPSYRSPARRAAFMMTQRIAAARIENPARTLAQAGRNSDWDDAGPDGPTDPVAGYTPRVTPNVPNWFKQGQGCTWGNSK